jgi:hypothetical protein
LTVPTGDGIIYLTPAGLFWLFGILTLIIANTANKVNGKNTQKKMLTFASVFAIMEWGVRAAGKAAAGGIHYIMDPLRCQAFI